MTGFFLFLTTILSILATDQQDRMLPFQESTIGRDSAVHLFLNNWHRAAAIADEERFFGSMAPGAIYLGTDPSERWTKESFEQWAMPHFQKATAWDFTPYDRQLYFSEDGNLCWFEELLDTWMGICRGSGVIERKDGEWKIRHYNLALTVYNEAIQEVISVNTPENGKK